MSLPQRIVGSIFLVLLLGFLAFQLKKPLLVLAGAPSINSNQILATYANNNLKNPTGISVAGTYLIISDTGHNTVRYFNMSSPQEGLTTIGNGNQGYIDSVTMSSVEFNAPTGLVGSIISVPNPAPPPAPPLKFGLVAQVADTGNAAIRTICIPLTGPPACAGLGVGTRTGGTVSNGLSGPVSLSQAQTMLVDSAANTVLNSQTSTSPTLTALNGNSVSGYVDGSLATAEFNFPTSIVTFPGGTAIADTGNNALRIINSQTVSTLAGSPTPGYADGPTTAARFNKPSGMVYNPADQYFYVADTFNSCIRRVDTSGNVTTYAGMCTHAGLVDSTTLSSAKLNKPTGIAISGSFMYISDSGNNCIRRLDMSQSAISTYIQ